MIIVGVLREVKLLCDVLKSKFEMIDLGTMSYLLDIVVLINMSGQKTFLTQEGYIDHVLGRFGKVSCKPVGTQKGKHMSGMQRGGDKQ